MAIRDDDGFGYDDVDRMVAARRGLGLRCDREFVQQLVDGSLPTVRAQEYGLLTPPGRPLLCGVMDPLLAYRTHR